MSEPYWLEVPPHVVVEDGDVVWRMSMLEAERVARKLDRDDAEMRQVAEAIERAADTLRLRGPR